MKYTLSEAIISNGKIIGYNLIEDTGEVKKAKLSDIANLVSRNLLNATVIKDDNGELHVLANGNIIAYDDNTIYTIESRIMHDGKVKSYKCKDNNGNIKNIPIDVVWELAVKGKIAGINGKVINGKRALTSSGINLSNVRVITN